MKSRKYLLLTVANVGQGQVEGVKIEHDLQTNVSVIRSSIDAVGDQSYNHDAKTYVSCYVLLIVPLVGEGRARCPVSRTAVCTRRARHSHRTSDCACWVYLRDCLYFWIGRSSLFRRLTLCWKDLFNFILRQLVVCEEILNSISRFAFIL